MLGGDDSKPQRGSAAANLHTWVRREPLFVTSLAAAAGIILGDHLVPSTSFPLPNLLLALIGVLALARGWRWLTPWGFALLVTLFGFAAGHGHRIDLAAKHPLTRALEDASAEGMNGIRIRGKGRITEEPVTLGTGEYVEETRLVGTACANSPRAKASRVALVVRAPPGSFQMGDQVAFEGRLTTPAAPRNPGAFDQAAFLQRNGLIGILDLRSEDHLEIHGNRVPMLLTLALRSRDAVASILTRDLDEGGTAAALVQAMTLGLRDRIPSKAESQFRNSGTLHLFAVSGLHVGMVAFIAWLLLKPLGLSRSWLTMTLIPILFFYALLTGWRPSAVRASTMASVFLAGQCVLRQPRILNSLGLAALVILLHDSQQLFLLGFQLSFSVLLAIVLLAGPLQGTCRGVLHPDPMRPMALVTPVEQRAYAIRRWAAGLVAVSAAAWIGSLPYMIWVFHQLTPVALLANPCLVPMAFLVLFASALSVLCNATGILAWASLLLNNANLAITHGMLALTGFFADLPGSHFPVSGRLPWSRPPVEVTVLDMPEAGSASLIHHHGHASELVDTGNVEGQRWVLQPFLRQQGHHHIDRVWLTHGDVAHIGGALEWVHASHTPTFHSPTWPTRSPTLKLLEERTHQERFQLTRVRALDTFPVGPEVYWECLYPPEDERFAPSRADDRGLVLLLHALEWRILFLSDAGFHTEQWLLENRPGLSAEVLIKDHHRADWSGTSAFLEAVSPRLVIWDSDSAGLLPTMTRSRLSRPPVFFDQARAGAVRLQIRADSLSAAGFCAPHEALTLKRAR